jgi:hypothetical protein
VLKADGSTDVCGPSGAKVPGTVGDGASDGCSDALI